MVEVVGSEREDKGGSSRQGDRTSAQAIIGELAKVVQQLIIFNSSIFMVIQEVLVGWIPTNNRRLKKGLHQKSCTCRPVAKDP